MKKLFALLFCFVACNMSYAQNNVGINTTTPDPSAALDVRSTTQGILVPRMSMTDRIAIVNPAKGLLVYDSTANAYYYYNGSAWDQMGTVSSGSGTSNINLRTKGKKMALMGDSITDTTWQNNWPVYMRDMLGVSTVINKAVSGATLTSNPGAVSNGFWLENQVTSLYTDNPADDIDIIVVAIGTNDQSYGTIPIGDVNTAMNNTAYTSPEDIRAATEEKKYISNALRMNMWDICLKWPKAKKYFVLPLQRVGVTIIAATPITPTYQMPYIQPIIDMCKYYGFTVINAFGESQILWQVEKDYNTAHPGQWLYTMDGLHPTTSGSYNGSKRLAELISGKILSTF